MSLKSEAGAFTAEADLRDGEHGTGSCFAFVTLPSAFFRSLFDDLVMLFNFVLEKLVVLWSLCTFLKQRLCELEIALPSLSDLSQQPRSSEVQDCGACACASSENRTSCFYVSPDGSVAEVRSCEDVQRNWRVVRYADFQVNGSMVLLSHPDGKDVFFVGSDSKLHQLHRHEHHNWTWRHTRYDALTISQGSKLFAGRTDKSTRLFWCGGDGRFNQLHMGDHNGWQWQQVVHQAPALQRSQSNSATLVCHNDVVNLFWIGSDSKLHELHHGLHNNWRWQHTMHDAPAMFQGSKLLAGRNDCSMRIFWLGNDGWLHELHMGDHNEWQWQQDVHEAPGLQQSQISSATAVCQKDAFNLFWVGSDCKLHELHHGQHNNWLWQHTMHNVPSMCPDTTLTSCRSRQQFAVFWIGTDSLLHIMHQGTREGWEWKHAALQPFQ